MHLDYLLFDRTDEDSGAGSFDALASVLPDRLPALLREVEAVLHWAHRAFGAPGAADAGGWDFDLQATGPHGEPLHATYDAARERASVDQAVNQRVALSLTVSGPAGFCDAFGQAFPASE